MQQPPHDQQRNNQHNPHQHQGGQSFKAGMLPPGQQPRPPPLSSPPGNAAGSDKQPFVVQGKTVQMFHPFASQFGKGLRDEISRIYDSDNDPAKTAAKAVCRPVMCAIRKATDIQTLCDKWITTGRCKELSCKNAHPDWDPGWNGQWLFRNCPELATLARVPPTWEP